MILAPINLFCFSSIFSNKKIIIIGKLIIILFFSLTTALQVMQPDARLEMS